MGTINYKTSDYITVGYNCNLIENDDDRIFAEDDYFQVLNRINYLKLYYFHVEIEPGYYEGFSINIENNFPWCFDNSIEKQEAQKEITEIKAFLIECIEDFCLCAVSPGWCTTYFDRKESMKRIRAAINEMREEVKNTCTYRTLPESEKIPLF